MNLSNYVEVHVYEYADGSKTVLSVFDMEKGFIPPPGGKYYFTEVVGDLVKDGYKLKIITPMETSVKTDAQRVNYLFARD